MLRFGRTLCAAFRTSLSWTLDDCKSWISVTTRYSSWHRDRWPDSIPIWKTSNWKATDSPC